MREFEIFLGYWGFGCQSDVVHFHGMYVAYAKFNFGKSLLFGSWIDSFWALETIWIILEFFSELGSSIGFIAHWWICTTSLKGGILFWLI